ncbi:MAG: 2,3-diketo-L-gulonate-binding periplasmic protein YiaO precursor [Syntrophorhabdus sp. PtaU1.Bin058]|nr:MAG: 2,3-diketo-L-gulonate-binding periplasmic protein YiaO precursor [Syntrophorhabdus sp. PtaU1.Bin058]
MKICRLAVLLLLFSGLIYQGVAWSLEITLGVVTKPGAAQNVCADKFKELLEARSAYKVRIYDSGSLGTEVEILKKIQAGDVHMGVITSGPFDRFVPEVRVIDYPYLFKDYEEVDRILEGPLGQRLLRTLEKSGFKGLAFSENGFRHLTNSKRPVHTVEDVAGLKIRVMESALHKELWRLFGADPVPIGDLKKVVADLQSKAVDGQENPLSAIWLDDFYKGQTYLSLTGHVYSSHIGVAGLKWFQGLSKKDRKLIMQCMEEAARYQRRWSRDNQAGFLDKIKAAGIIVDERPDIASFRKRASRIQGLEIFKVKEVQNLLRAFLKATAGDGR